MKRASQHFQIMWIVGGDLNSNFIKHSLYPQKWMIFTENCVQIPEGNAIDERELIKDEKDQLADCTWTAKLFTDLIKGISGNQALENKSGLIMVQRKEKKWRACFYGKLLQVDFMLGSYMEDIGITAKEFEAACTQGKSITGKFHQQLFEQVESFLFSLSRLSPFSFLWAGRTLSLFLHTLPMAGVGCGRLWDFQEDDDPEEHRPSDGSLRIVTAEV